jgi:hypothetical protein
MTLVIYTWELIEDEAILELSEYVLIAERIGQLEALHFHLVP